MVNYQEMCSAGSLTFNGFLESQWPIYSHGILLPCSLGVDFYSKALELDDKVISLQLWDTAGQERFQSVTKAYYRGAQGIILVYDISQEESFIAVKSWISTIQVYNTTWWLVM